jgi:hippurate hydrolase
MLDRIQAEADAAFGDVVDLRRTIHRRPELALDEHETARLVIDTLEPLGLDLRTEVYHTGVVATLEGGRPGPTLLLRADMDALPIHEATGLDFASERDGAMHACGHDAHTASLLGTAMILSRLREDVRGHVRFLFQPSEEVVPGGAKFMIEEGALDDQTSSPAPEAVFGQHVEPGLPVGQIGVRAGMYMASADEIHVTLHGEGGHAAAPHELAADVVVAGAHVVTALQTVVSRHAPPGVPSVVTVGRFVADGATNVLPETATLKGTFRTMDEEWRFRAHDLIRRVINGTAEALGARADVEVVTGYPSLYNHAAPTDLVRACAEDYVGAENTVELEPWPAGEDFAYFLQERPGSFYRLGVRNEDEGIVHGVHTPQFTIDEEALRVGPGFMAYLAWRYGAEQAA